jgi:hypothetical protein
MKTGNRNQGVNILGCDVGSRTENDNVRHKNSASW